VVLAAVVVVIQYQQAVLLLLPARDLLVALARAITAVVAAVLARQEILMVQDTAVTGFHQVLLARQ
jgi:hypothetical protein